MKAKDIVTSPPITVGPYLGDFADRGFRALPLAYRTAFMLNRNPQPEDSRCAPW